MHIETVKHSAIIKPGNKINKDKIKTAFALFCSWFNISISNLRHCLLTKKGQVAFDKTLIKETAI